MTPSPVGHAADFNRPCLLALGLLAGCASPKKRGGDHHAPGVEPHAGGWASDPETRKQVVVGCSRPSGRNPARRGFIWTLRRRRRRKTDALTALHWSALGGQPAFGGRHRGRQRLHPGCADGNVRLLPGDDHRCGDRTPAGYPGVRYSPGSTRIYQSDRARPSKLPGKQTC